MGVGFFCRPLGIPRAEARLLAIDEERSRALDLKALGSRGGWMVFSGDGGLLESCFVEVGAFEVVAPVGEG